MLERQKSFLIYGNQFCGIEHTTEHGQDLIYATCLKQVKEELHLDKAITADSIEAISIQLQKNKHAILIINNTSVLTKTIENTRLQDPLKLVYKAFPNINSADFYFEVLSEKNIHFIALCRKDYVESLIASYAAHKVFITDVSFGNHLIAAVKPYIETDEIITSNALISITDTSISKIEKLNISSENYAINGLQVNSNSLLSFSGALQSILKNTTTLTNFLARKESLESRFKNQRFFSQFLKFSGIFILGLLLVNFFVFNYYFGKVNDLEQRSAFNNTTKEKVQALNEVVSKKQKMVEDLLKGSRSKSSFYTHEVMQSLPASILLTAFNYQPLLKQVKANKAIVLETNSISISGTSNNSEVFSKWLSALETKVWISKIAIEDYGAASKNTAKFKLKITLAND